MGKTWVLDTETKGTGAEMVPLEKVQQRSSRGRRPALAPKPEPRPAPPPAAPKPRRFRLVDVMTGRILADDADAPAALDVLRRVRSVVDIRAYVWNHEADVWRPLTLAEQKVLWKSRGAASPQSGR
jgi:hypothetical protein